MAPKTICIVDDDPLVHFVTRKILKDYVSDDKVFSFAHGEQILEFLVENATDEETLPDIILLDIHMPHLTGIEFLEKYEAIKTTLSKQVNIYIISSSMNRNEIYRVKNDPNALGFINKPISKEMLEIILEN